MLRNTLSLFLVFGSLFMLNNPVISQNRHSTQVEKKVVIEEEKVMEGDEPIERQEIVEIEVADGKPNQDGKVKVVKTTTIIENGQETTEEETYWEDLATLEKQMEADEGGGRKIEKIIEVEEKAASEVTTEEVIVSDRLGLYVGGGLIVLILIVLFVSRPSKKPRKDLM